MPVELTGAIQLSDGRVLVGVTAVRPVGESGAASAAGAAASTPRSAPRSAIERAIRGVRLRVPLMVSGRRDEPM